MNKPLTRKERELTAEVERLREENARLKAERDHAVECAKSLGKENEIMLTELEYVWDWCCQDEDELEGDRIKDVLDKVKGQVDE